MRDIYAQLWNLHPQNKMAENRDLFSKLSLMLNLDHDIPGTRLYLMKKRGIFKTTVWREKDTRITPEIAGSSIVLRRSSPGCVHEKRK